jgi:hypothetical protein
MKHFIKYLDDKNAEKDIEMKMNAAITENDKTMYAAHDYYGSPKKMVFKRKSPSSSGGNGNGGE